MSFVILLMVWNFDSWFLMRLGIPYLYISKRKDTIKDIFRTHVFHSVVMPADLDFTGHMNNARYVREADIARCHFFAEYKMVQTVRALGGYMVMNANCSRFHQALNVFEHFDIRTHILGWDDRLLYVEQLFVRPSNGLVVAVVLARFNMTGTTPAVVMERLTGTKVRNRTL